MTQSTNLGISQNGLICAYLLDGKGGGREAYWQDVNEWTATAECLWIHLAAEDPRACAWIEKESGIPELAAEALFYNRR